MGQGDQQSSTAGLAFLADMTKGLGITSEHAHQQLEKPTKMQVEKAGCVNYFTTMVYQCVLILE